MSRYGGPGGVGQGFGDPGSANGGAGNRPRTSSFLHGLPPPVPSNGASPRSYFPPSPRDTTSSPATAAMAGGGGGVIAGAATAAVPVGIADPQAWATDRQSPSSRRWMDSSYMVPSTMPTMAAGVTGTGAGAGANGLPRLSSLADYPHRAPATNTWDTGAMGGAASIMSRSPGFADHQRAGAVMGGGGGFDARYDYGGAPPVFHNNNTTAHHVHPSTSSYDHDLQRSPSPADSSSRFGGGLDSHNSPNPSGHPRSSNKHGAPGSPGGGTGEKGGGGSNKKKKRRVALSCAECAKRKQKCNRETPCQHCVARRVPELCVPYARPGTPPPKRGGAAQAAGSAGNSGINGVAGSGRAAAAIAAAGDLSARDGSPAVKDEREAPPVKPPQVLPTLSVRVQRLEAVVNSMINRVGGLEGAKSLRDWRINHAPATTPPPSDGREFRRMREPSVNSSTSRPHTAGLLMERDGSAEASVHRLDGESMMRNPVPQSMMESSEPVPLGLDYHGTPAEQLQNLFHECGVSPDKLQELMQDLPPVDFARSLVDWFFEKFNHVRYPIDELLFRKAFDELYENQSIEPRSVIVLPLVYIALAIATRIAPDDLLHGDDHRRSWSLRMYWNSKMAILMASAVKAENLHLVETRILTGLYLILMHERRLAEGWTEFRAAIAIGQAIGLHRDGSKLGLDPYMTEYRRRLWSYLVHADATYSCLLGRPVSIDPNYVDTLPPSNIDLEDIRADPKVAPKPMTTPTYATYLILRERLGALVAKVVQHFQKLHDQGGYRDVEKLDAEFKQLVADLPPAFAMHSPDKSQDGDLWYLAVHRYYIQTEILHFTILLHRPWLLRKLRTNRYSLSRSACYEAAVTDFKIRQAFKREHPEFFETLLGGSFREFNCAMIAGISLIIDPRGLHASDMRQLIQFFMEHYPHDTKMDDFSQKESAIIHTLYRRGIEFEEKRRNTSRFSLKGNVSSERTAPRPVPVPVPVSSAANMAEGSPHGSEPSSSRSGASQTAAGDMPPPPSGGMGTIGDAAQQTSASNGQMGRDSADPPMGQDPLHMKSSVSAFLHREGGLPGQAGGTGGVNSMGHNSPEDDQAQRLLDHWLVSNTSFGPGSDLTVNPFTGVYPSYFPAAAVQPPGSGVGGVPMSNGMTTISSNGYAPGPMPFTTAGTGIPGMPAQLGGGPTGMISPIPGGGPGGLGGGVMLPPGAAGADGGVGVPGGGGGGAMMPAAGGLGGQMLYGDGNNLEYWDTLIDGIMVNKNGYEGVSAQSA